MKKKEFRAAIQGALAVVTMVFLLGCEGDGGGGGGVACGPYSVSVNDSPRQIEISGVGALPYDVLARFQTPTADAKIGDTPVALRNMQWNGEILTAFDITIDGTHSCHWPG